jgi:hypothetical protein
MPLPEFVAPAQGDFWKPSDAIGHLLIIDVLAVEAPRADQYKPGQMIEPVKATIHDVDAQDTSEEALIFTGSLIGALKPRVGSKVLARLGQGTAKPGQSAPYILLDASSDPSAVEAATKHLREWQAGQFQAPAASTAPAASNGQTPDVVAALAALKAAGIPVPGQ